MDLSSNRLIYWTPRILTIPFALFISLFAFDGFRFCEVEGILKRRGGYTVAPEVTSAALPVV